MKSIFLASLMLSISAVCAPMAFLPLNTASAPVSAGIHASISGTVTRVDEKSITIEE